MTIGIVGLGRMGLSIAWRLRQAGHTVIGFDFSPEACIQAQEIDVEVVDTVATVAQKARILWLMVPQGQPVDDVLSSCKPYFQAGDIVIDGGNSYFRDSIRRHTELAKLQIFFIDCGTSGGLHGRDLGYCLMVGGDEHVYKKLIPLFQVISAPDGYAYMGPSGTGHYVKMVHNGIEYALLESYAEGFHMLKEGEFKHLDLEKISHVWQNGSIVRSWILNLAHEIFKQDQNFEKISGSIGENKTGQWTVDEAHKEDIPVPMIEKALAIRAWSRESGGNYATKLVALLRHQFGGHPVKKLE